MDIYIDDDNVDGWLDKEDVTDWLNELRKVRDDRWGTNEMCINALLRLLDGVPHNMRIIELRRIFEKNIKLVDDGTGLAR